MAGQADEGQVVWAASAGLAQLYRCSGRRAGAEREFKNTLATIDSRRSRLVQEESKLTFQASLVRFYQDYVDFLVESGKA